MYNRTPDTDYVHTHPDNDALLMHGDTVARFSMVGCYPVFHLTRDGGVLCGKCIDANLEECTGTATWDDGSPSFEDPQWFVAGHDANWEDPSLICGDCSGRSESAYAEVDADPATPLAHVFPS